MGPRWADEPFRPPDSRAEKAARLALAALPPVGVVSYTKLVREFGGAAAALAAGPEAWRRVGLGAAAEVFPRQSEGEALLRRAEEEGWSVVTLGEEDYPPLLLYTAYPPPVLYLRGRLKDGDWWSIAVVGTRRATDYGRWAAERLAGELVAEGFAVVSGLARGVDAAAHIGALKAGGRTIAVLGCGLDRVYPPEHAGLAAEIEKHGAVLSEFVPGTPPRPENFPRRNRILAGMTVGTMVVEAGERSGALNTAFQANDAGREVFAVPGEVGRQGSAGPHLLLALGAELATHGHRIGEAMRRPYPPGFHPARPWGDALSGLRERPRQDPGDGLWRVLREGPRRPWELASRLGLPVSQVTARLVLWQLEGKVREYPDGRVAAVR